MNFAWRPDLKDECRAASKFLITREWKIPINKLTAAQNRQSRILRLVRPHTVCPHLLMIVFSR